MAKQTRKFQTNSSQNSNRVMIQCRTAVNRDAVRRESIDGVEHVIVSSATLPDDIVMNGGLYPADEIAESFESLELTLAPIEHPSIDGQFISANDPRAIHEFHAGAFNMNVRREDGRVWVDKFINVQEANKTERGKRLLDRINELETSSDPRPIHTSVGVFVTPEELSEPQTNADGDEFTWIARDMFFDHDAILLDSVGAAQPHQGVGVAVNRRGEECRVDQFTIGQADGQSVSQLHQSVMEALERAAIGAQWIEELFTDRVIFWVGEALFEVPFVVDDEGRATIVGIPLPVERNVTFTPKNNHSEGDVMSKAIINALAELGIQINGALADRLNDLLDQRSDDAGERSDLIDRMADAAGITRDTLLSILRGDIETPPEERLRGFAEVLGVSLESLTALVGNHSEGDAMRALMLKALADAGITVNADISDADLLAKYNGLQANQSEGDGDGAGDDQGIAQVVANAVAQATKPLADKLESVEAKLNSADDAELDRMAEMVGNSDKFPGLDAEAAKKLGVDTLKSMVGNCVPAYGVSPMVNAGSGGAESTVPTDMPQ